MNLESYLLKKNAQYHNNPGSNFSQSFGVYTKGTCLQAAQGPL